MAEESQVQDEYTPTEGEVAALAQAASEADLAADVAAVEEAEAHPTAHSVEGVAEDPLVEITPLYDRILVEQLPERETVKGGIVLPEAHREKPQEGTVVGVGCGRILPDGRLLGLRCHVGDRVLFGRYSGTKVEIEYGQEVLVLREDEILAVIKRASQLTEGPTTQEQ